MLALIPLLVALTPPQAKAEVISDSRALAKKSKADAEKNFRSRQMIMQDQDDPKVWRVMKHEEAHLDSDGMWAAGDVAFVWVKNGHVTFASFSKGSASGDWSASAEYTYRPDGTLAHMSMRYAAFSPVEGVLVRERIFDREGKIVHQGVKATSLDGKKLLSREKVEEMKSFEPKAENYLSDHALPFAKLIKFG